LTISSSVISHTLPAIDVSRVTVSFSSQRGYTMTLQCWDPG